jgi:hypothetical protein
MVVAHTYRQVRVFSAFFEIGELFQNIYIGIFRVFHFDGHGFSAFFSVIIGFFKIEFFPRSHLH